MSLYFPQESIMLSWFPLLNRTLKCFRLNINFCNRTANFSVSFACLIKCDTPHLHTSWLYGKLSKSATCLAFNNLKITLVRVLKKDKDRDGGGL